MRTVHRSALVPYAAAEMYELVSAIEDYPKFLPWCAAAEVLSRDAQQVVAKLELRYKGLHQSFTTRNVLYPNDSMEMHLVEGPFKTLYGRWEFDQLTQEGCCVLLEMQFMLANPLLELFAGAKFEHAANTLVDSFCQRARTLYGNAAS